MYKNKEGYSGDEEESYISFGLFVNAWRPLPELYKEENYWSGGE